MRAHHKPAKNGGRGDMGGGGAVACGEGEPRSEAEGGHRWPRLRRGRMWYRNGVMSGRVMMIWNFFDDDCLT